MVSFLLAKPLLSANGEFFVVVFVLMRRLLWILPAVPANRFFQNALTRGEGCEGTGKERLRRGKREEDSDSNKSRTPKWRITGTVGYVAMRAPIAKLCGP